MLHSKIRVLHDENGAVLVPAWHRQGGASGCHVGAGTAPFTSRVLTAPFVCVHEHVRKILPPPVPSGPRKVGDLCSNAIMPSEQFLQGVSLCF